MVRILLLLRPLLLHLILLVVVLDQLDLIVFGKCQDLVLQLNLVLPLLVLVEILVLIIVLVILLYFVLLLLQLLLQVHLLVHHQKLQLYCCITSCCICNCLLSIKFCKLYQSPLVDKVT